MSFPKVLTVIIVLLFGTIAVAALFKGKKEPSRTQISQDVVEIAIDNEEVVAEKQPETTVSAQKEFVERSAEGLPTANRVNMLFNRRGPKLPIVETVAYTSRVPWMQGRPAWLADYAAHYNTTRHFIARSLNGRPDYFKQDVAEGDRFNVLRDDKNFEFYLLVDLSRSKMWFYYYDQDTNERALIKTYDVGLGRPDPSSASGLLTPLGTYSLGDKVAIYRPKKMGYYNGQKTEMVQVFGTRWIPFDEEIEGCSDAADGLGIHGLPWLPNDQGELVEDRDSLGQYASDGCVRLATEDIEELFSIVISKPTKVVLVQDFYDAKLPGTEVQP